MEDGDVAHPLGQVLHQPGVGVDTGGHVLVEDGLHQPRELHGVGCDHCSGVALFSKQME